MTSRGHNDRCPFSKAAGDQLEETIRKALEPQNDNGIFTNAMDEIVNVNNLFLIAVFLGISTASPEFQGLDKTCKLSNVTGMGKTLIMRDVLAFACFLFSSLLATSLKVYLNIHSEPKEAPSHGFHVFRASVFSMTVFATVAGVVLLTVSMADVVRIKVGRLLCGSPHALTTVILLALIVAIGVSVFLCAMFYNLIQCWYKHDTKKHGSSASPRGGGNTA